MVEKLNDPGRGDNKGLGLFGSVPADRKGYPADLFGEIQLRSDNHGFCRWDWVQLNAKNQWGSDGNRQFRYGPWSIHMNGGEQDDGEDWASVWIPVNDMPLTDLKKILFTYYKFSAGTSAVGVCGPNFVIATKDPKDPTHRAELSQQASHGASVTAGWHDDLTTGKSTKYTFYYGDNLSSGLTEGTLYTLADFQADVEFKNHVIYLIKIDYGFWDGARTTGDCWLGGIYINDYAVPMRPSLDEQIYNVIDQKLNAVKTVPAWRFGQPEIRCDNGGWGAWEKVALNAKDIRGSDYNRQFRYGIWAVHLNGGPQALTTEDWASLCIPVNNMPLVDFYEIAWTYYKFLAGTADVGAAPVAMVLQTRHPYNYDERADITQTASAVGAVTAGWHECVMRRDTAAQCFWYGNNITSDITEGANATIKAFQEDKGFAEHVVYMIRFEYGYWGGTRAAGDIWLGSVRINNEEIPLIPSDRNDLGSRPCFQKDGWVFGKPTLISNNNGKASWFKSGTSPYHQKSATGFLANLYGGVQSAWNDWAAIYIPVNDLPVSCFDTARWTYYMTEAEAFGVNMVIWVHDPFDFDKRGEITQQADISGLEKGAGWNAHELDQDTSQFYYYAEGEANESICTSEGPGNLYTWEQYRGDECFNTWTIYRISFEYGWHSGDNEFKDTFVADIQLNDELIPLYPDTKKYYRTVRVQKTLEADGAYGAKDVMSESDTNSAGTDWDFEFGGVGEIIKALAVTDLTTATAALTLLLYSAPPTCELDDNAANDGPNAADTPYFLGRVEFDALASEGGSAFAIITKADEGGGLPIAFDRPKIYGVLLDTTGQDFDDAAKMDIILTAEMEA